MDHIQFFILGWCDSLGRCARSESLLQHEEGSRVIASNFWKKSWHLSSWLDFPLGALEACCSQTLFHLPATPTQTQWADGRLQLLEASMAHVYAESTVGGLGLTTGKRWTALSSQDPVQAPKGEALRRPTNYDALSPADRRCISFT